MAQLGTIFKDEINIIEWLDEMGLKSYELRRDAQHGFVVDVVGDVILIDKGLKYFPVQFGRVSGIFDCSHNHLTSLKGSPEEVGLYFSCEHNALTNLEYCPRIVGHEFYCIGNLLDTLAYIPLKVGGQFFCRENKGLGFVQTISKFNEIIPIHREHIVREERRRIEEMLPLERETGINSKPQHNNLHNNELLSNAKDMQGRIEEGGEKSSGKGGAKGIGKTRQKNKI